MNVDILIYGGHVLTMEGTGVRYIEDGPGRFVVEVGAQKLCLYKPLFV